MSLTQEENYNFIRYDQAAKENKNFYRVVYTSDHRQIVLSSIPPGGIMSQRTFKDTDVDIRIADGEAIVTIGGGPDGIQTHNVTAGHDGHVDKGEFVIIKNFNPDRALKLVLKFSPPVMPEGAIYATDPYPTMASISPIAISPNIIRTTIQTPQPQVLPVGPVPIQTFVSQPVTTVSTPVPSPVLRTNSPLSIEPYRQPMTQQVFVPQQTVPVTTSYTTYTPRQIPVFPSGTSVEAPTLPTVKPLI
jgi:hypothetical protein